jgi:hypothetical protein
MRMGRRVVAWATWACKRRRLQVHRSTTEAPVRKYRGFLPWVTGSSRVLLQVHYFSDVLAGWASAAAWIAFCITGWEIVRRSRSRSLQATR